MNVDVRHKAAESLCTACRDYPRGMIPHLDSLLGYYAILCEQTEPPPQPPRIVLPGDTPDDPVLKNLTEGNRRQRWGFLKQKLVECMKELAEADPATVGERAMQVYERLDTRTHSAFKAAIVSLLGEIGKDYSSQARVLPLLMRALVDYGSQSLRAAAINAVAEMYRHAQTNPPTDVLDVLIVHLRDTFVIVHQAAVHAFQLNIGHLSRSQTAEALTGMLGLVNAYRDDPYELKDICQAVLKISRPFRDLRKYGLAIVSSIFPTKDRLVDEDIVEEIVDLVEPNDDAAEIIVNMIAWCFSEYRRDSNNSYDYDSRSKMFAWLFRVPSPLYARVRSTLLEAAQKLAVKDVWESFHFAALFAQFGDYAAEQAVLTTALNSVPDEKRLDNSRKVLTNLATMAGVNACLVDGQTQRASDLMGTIQGDAT